MKFVHDGREQTWLNVALNIGLLIPSLLGYAGRARRTLGPRFFLCTHCHSEPAGAGPSGTGVEARPILSSVAGNERSTDAPFTFHLSHHLILLLPPIPYTKRNAISNGRMSLAASPA